MRANERKQETIAAVLLARGLTRRRTAKAAGISEATLYRWLQDADFKKRIADLRKEYHDSMVGQLAALGAMAIKRLERLLNSENENVAIAAVREWRTATIDFTCQDKLADAASPEEPIKSIEEMKAELQAMLDNHELPKDWQ